MSTLKPETAFLICKITGFGLIFAIWLSDGEITGFFLLLVLVLMSLLRRRFPKLRATVLIDGIACALLMAQCTQYALVFVIFQGMYHRYYWVGFVGLLAFQAETPFVPNYFDPIIAILLLLGALCGLFLGKWQQEQAGKFTMRDKEAGKLYEIEHLQNDIADSLPQIERMAAVAERARIARDIHDNAGHEIVAAYISLQTTRALFEAERLDAEALELYDAALGRLSKGVDKIRQTAHNLQTVTMTGVESLLEICQKFPGAPVNFSTYGDTSHIPMYVWSVLEACLNESLTNVARHAHPSYIRAELDATQHIVRFCIENDGVAKSANIANDIEKRDCKRGSQNAKERFGTLCPSQPITISKVVCYTRGTGLSNLRRRAISIGGSLSIDAGKVFRVICVIPLERKEGQSEAVNS